jgi:hypothetical protein
LIVVSSLIFAFIGGSEKEGAGFVYLFLPLVFMGIGVLGIVFLIWSIIRKKSKKFIIGLFVLSLVCFSGMPVFLTMQLVHILHPIQFAKEQLIKSKSDEGTLKYNQQKLDAIFAYPVTVTEASENYLLIRTQSSEIVGGGIVLFVPNINKQEFGNYTRENLIGKQIMVKPLSYEIEVSKKGADFLKQYGYNYQVNKTTQELIKEYFDTHPKNNSLFLNTEDIYNMSFVWGDIQAEIIYEGESLNQKFNSN